MAIAAGLLCALLALASHRYAGIFRNDRTLWAYAVEKTPHSTFAQNNLGNALYLDGHVAEAAARYAKALQLDPEDVEAHYNLGNILAEGGRIPEAISEYRQAIKLQPDLYEAPASIGYLGGAPDPSALGAVDSLNAAAIIYGKEVPHQDLWVSYKMRLPFIDNRIRSTLQLNCRDLWSNGYLQTVQVNPDGSPVTYRIIAPRQWYLQETFDF